MPSPDRSRQPRGSKAKPKTPAARVRRKLTVKPATTRRPHPAAPPVPQALGAVGRRKSAVARARFIPGTAESLTINDQPLVDYFPVDSLQQLVRQPLAIIGHRLTGSFAIRVTGGGKRGQAEAVRLGIARLLATADPSVRPSLKHAGLLRRDPRIKERKKYGLKRARRAPQWQKR